MLKDIAELKARGFTETNNLPVLVVPAAESVLRSNPRLAWHPRSEEESFERAYAVGAAYSKVPAERYTSIPKLGLNPVNKYNTPTGLYWYPLEKTSDFATDRPYRITANLVGMGVDLSKVSEEHIEEMRALLVDVFRVYFSLEDVWEHSKFFIENSPDRWQESYTQRSAQEKRAALWWAVTRYCADKIARYQKRKREDAWTSVFRALGIDFVLDPGLGVVHRLEPSQIVSFSNNTDVLKDVAIEDNHKASETWEGRRATFYKVLVKKDKGTLLVKNLAKRTFQKQNFSVGDTLLLEGDTLLLDGSFEDLENISLTVVRFLQRGLLVLLGENFFAITANVWSSFDSRETGNGYALQQSSLNEYLDDDYEEDYPLAEHVTPEENPEYFED